MFDALTISFVLYTAGIIAIGLYSARFSKKTEADFFLADRGLGAWVAALSSSASAESGWVTLGLVGMAYKTGIGALWIVLGTFVAFLFNWFLLAWRLRSTAAQYESLTLPDVLAAKFRGTSTLLIRIVGIVIVLSMLTAYVAAQLNAAGKVFQGTFEFSYLTGVLIGTAIVVIYTITGGFRAVAWTDVVQGTFMLIIVAVLPALLIRNLGGIGVFWENLRDDPTTKTLTDPFGGNQGLMLIGFLALWLGVPVGNPGQPHVLVRLMAVKDKAAVLRGGVISSLWVLVLFSGAVMLGMAARASSDTLGVFADPENTLMHIARNTSIVPGVIGGMIISAVLAAICSTADSQLLVSASAISHDLITRIFGVKLSLNKRLILDRGAVLVVGLVATVIAASEARSVFQFVLDYGWAGLGAGFGPALILTLFWKRASGWGILSAMVVGVTTSIVWKQFPDLHKQVYNLVPAFAFAMVAGVVVSLLTPCEQVEPSQSVAE